ncbi:MAG: hypothetical protein C0598_01900, partial [Marinilabiliales bacterium]
KTFELLEGLLDWGKTQRGLIKASKLKFNVKSELDEIVRVNKSQLENKELILENNVENTLEIYNDQKLFRHIIMNILNNAIKFTPRGGSITIYSENKNGKDQICIKDTGIGFPNDVKSKVFTFDFDYNRSGTESEKSTGMGLILISEYARIMGASLSLESKENEGSTFKLSL